MSVQEIPQQLQEMMKELEDLAAFLRVNTVSEDLQKKLEIRFEAFFYLLVFYVKDLIIEQSDAQAKNQTADWNNWAFVLNLFKVPMTLANMEGFWHDLKGMWDIDMRIHLRESWLHERSRNNRWGIYQRSIEETNDIPHMLSRPAEGTDNTVSATEPMAAL